MDNEVVKDKLSQGIMLMTAGNYKAAKECFENVIKDEPRNLEAYVHLGNACANLELYDEALETFKKTLIIDDTFSEAYFSMGSIYVLKNDKVKAIENFNKAEEKGYQSSQMYQIMASIFFDENDEPQAVRNISRAINVSPLDGKLRLFKAQIYLAFNRYEQALETLDEMEKVLPDAFEVYDLKSQIYLGQERYEEALSVIERGCERFPEDSNLSLIKLKVLVLSDKFVEAYEWINYIKSNGHYETNVKNASIQEATLLLKEKKVDEACTLLKEVNEKLNGDADVLYLINDILGKTGKNEELLEYSNKLMNMECGDFYKATAMFFHATALDALGKEEAMAEFKNIVKVLRKMTIASPSFYEGYLYRLLSHVKLKEFDKALELAEYIENLYPERSDGHAFKYYIYKEMGSSEEASREREIAKNMNPNLDIL